MKTRPFEHSPLDPADLRAIQILELLPSPDLKGPIRCELHHHSLDEEIQYEAVSYRWGDPEPGHTVFVNGAYTLDVTPNCLEALTCLRQRSRRRRLWIDAICIDQRENDTSKRDRDRQVKIMGDIYHQARKVLVWLGPAEPSSSRTIARLWHIAIVRAAKRSANFGSSALTALEKYLSDRMIETYDCGSFPRARYGAIASMVCSPWWQRVWTVQEQVLARQCWAHHGRHSFPLSFLQTDQLKIAIDYLTHGDSWYNHEIRHYIGMICQLSGLPQELFDPPRHQWEYDNATKLLLEMAFLLQSRHPIDKIYGLYGVLKVYCNLPLPTPDYNKTAEKVYQETAWAWIKTRRDLNILKLSARPNFVQELPSWVPAWHKKHPSLIRNINHTFDPEQFQVLSNSHFIWTRSRDTMLSEAPSEPFSNTEDPIPVADILAHGKLRILRARFAGRVSWAVGTDRSNDWSWYQDSIEGLYVHLDWCRLIHHIFSHSMTRHEEALHEMFRSIVHPGIHQLRMDYQNSELFESFRAWFNFMLYLSEESGSPTSMVSEMADMERSQAQVKLYHDACMAAQEEEAMCMLERRYDGSVHEGVEGLSKLAGHVRSTRDFLAYMRNHRLCVLDNDDMLAVTDYWCQEGDEVFVFPGTDSPFVLRKQPEGDCYRLVGPALVDRLLRVGYQNWRSEGDNLQNIVLI